MRQAAVECVLGSQGGYPKGTLTRTEWLGPAEKRHAPRDVPPGVDDDRQTGDRKSLAVSLIS
jgi:hypothetical protein